MKKIVLLLLSIYAFFTASGQAVEPNINITILKEAKEAIMASHSMYFDAFVKNDPTIFVNCYTKDACIMTPNSPALCGSKAVASFFTIAYEKYGLRNGKFIRTGIYGDGKEFMLEEGLWQSFDEKGKMFNNGKFVVVWKKTAEGWKMFRDSFSSNLN